jgi:hypothetical protein
MRLELRQRPYVTLLSVLLEKQCAVARLTTLGRIASAFDSWSQPLSEEQERWTRGFALLCVGASSTKQIDACETGVFKIYDNSTVIVYRRERETRVGTLDYRRGGWGPVRESEPVSPP